MLSSSHAGRELTGAGDARWVFHRGGGWSGPSARCRMEAAPTSPPLEDFMFQRKSRTVQLTEQIQNQSESLACTAAAVADQLRERLVPAAGQATEKGKEWARHASNTVSRWQPPGWSPPSVASRPRWT